MGVDSGHAPEMATEEGGTRPTGIHSCLTIFSVGISFTNKKIHKRKSIVCLAEALDSWKE